MIGGWATSGPARPHPMPDLDQILGISRLIFPTGSNYVVGQSRWSTDWNFVQPNVVNSQGTMNGSISTITFNLAQAPTNGATASLYIGLCSDDAGPSGDQREWRQFAGQRRWRSHRRTGSCRPQVISLPPLTTCFPSATARATPASAKASRRVFRQAHRLSGQPAACRAKHHHHQHAQRRQPGQPRDV